METNNKGTTAKSIFHYGFLLLAMISLGAACHYRSIFEIGCTTAAVLFWLLQFRMKSISGRDNATQQKKCRPVGLLMIFPSLLVIASSISLLFIPTIKMPELITYCFIGTAGTMAICQILQFVWMLREKSVAARFLRYSSWAAASAPLAVFIALTMKLAPSEESLTLACMSGAIFGAIALLIAVNLFLVSCFQYKSTRKSMDALAELFRNNRLVFTRVSILKDAFMVVGKLVLSVISVSFFMLVNAMYSTGMGLARFVALKMHEQERTKQIRGYRNVGIIIMLASFCYVLYSIRLFYGEKTGSYPMEISLAIAAYTFVEFGIVIRDIFRLRKSHALEAKALRAISLAATLLCFVITQTAIMSFSEASDATFSNALSGIFFGAIAMLVGVYVIIRSQIIKKRSEV